MAGIVTGSALRIDLRLRECLIPRYCVCCLSYPNRSDAYRSSKEELELLGADVKVKAKELGLPMAFITSGKPSSRMKDYEKWLADGYAIYLPLHILISARTNPFKATMEK